jgi:hypothetical protein
LDAKIHTPAYDNKKVCWILKRKKFYFLLFSK